MTTKVCVLLCIEKGYLENTSKYLINSLRKFGGELKDVPIYSYQPRKKEKITDKTKRFLEKNEVEFIDINLNKEYEHYPLANKPIVCAHAEKHLESEIIVFLDSDIMILNQPSEFLIPANVDIMINPVYRKHIGTSGKRDINYDYWKKLYSLLGVKKYQYVKTIKDGEKIHAYFNSGHIAVRKNRGIFSAWEYNFKSVMKKGFMPKHGQYFIEQSVLGATISQLENSWSSFSETYNFHINLNIINNQRNKIPKFSSLTSLHYHDLFKKITTIHPIEPYLDSDEKSLWIKKSIYRHKLIVPRNIEH